MTEQFSLSTAKYSIYCRHNKQYVVLAATSGMGSFNKLIHTSGSKRTSIEEHEGHGVKILKEKV